LTLVTEVEKKKDDKRILYSPQLVVVYLIFLLLVTISRN